MRPDEIKVKILLSVPTILACCGESSTLDTAIEISPHPDNVWDRDRDGVRYILTSVWEAGIPYRQQGAMAVLPRRAVDAILVWLQNPWYANMSLSEFLSKMATKT